MSIRVLVFSLLLSTAFSPPSLAHPGGTNSQGCHTNRKTGDYHCHSARSAAPTTSSPSRAQASLPHEPTDSGPVVITLDVVRPSSRELIRLAQALLRNLSFVITDQAGILGHSTAGAIRSFQEGHSLSPDGRVSGELLIRLAEAAAANCPKVKPR